MKAFTLVALVFLSINPSFAQDIIFVSPQQDSVVQGVINIEVEIREPSTVAKVSFQWLEGDCRDVPSWGGCLIRSRGNIGVVNESPYAIDFDTEVLDNEKVYFIVACTTDVLGVEQCEQLWGLTPDNPDTTGPAIRYANFQIIWSGFTPWKGIVTLNSIVSDDSEITHVDFIQNDGQLIGRVTEPSTQNNAVYSVKWDTTRVNNGENDIVIVAADIHGNETRLTPFRLGWGRYIVENHYRPENITGRAKEYHVNIVWQGSDQKESYKVYRRLDSGTEFTLLGETDNLVWVDDLPIGSAFADYYVKAIYEYGESSPSDYVRVYPAFRR